MSARPELTADQIALLRAMAGRSAVRLNGVIVLALRRAADKLRTYATGADYGPWDVGPNFGARDNRVYVRQEGSLIDTIGNCIIAGQVANKTQFRENAAYIALMHPPVALALADWLDAAFEYADSPLTSPNWPMLARAVAVARSVLREDGESR